MATSRLHSHHSLPAPVVHAGFSVSQSKSHVLAGVQDAYWSDDEAEDAECPLCLEEMDVSDLNFKPCICGYQICRFCWHHIKENLNKRCPACRRVYTDDAVEFKPMPLQDHKRLTQQKKQRERERKELDNLNRRHLANVRVVQRNVVYVVGIGPRFAKEELISTLRSNEYFGQYGKITKIILVKRTPSGGGEPVVGLYITYHRREDAARAIAAVDGAPSTGGARGEIMRASYGTTKYCMAFLRGVSCSDHSCMNLHEWGDEKDCFTKEDLTTLKHTMKTTESRARSTVITQKKGDENDAGLPRAASWAQKPINLQLSSTTSSNHPSASTSATRQPKRGTVVRQPRNAPSNEARATAAPSRTATNESKTVATSKATSNTSSRPTTPSSLVPQRVTSPDVKDVKAKPKSQPVPPPSPDSFPRADEPESGPPSVVSPSPAPRSASADSTPVSIPPPPTLPPGLPAVPPGLTAPPGIPIPIRALQFDIAVPQTPILASQSSYQMSTAARALLDDVTARRESALPMMAGVSPFPDFDRTLQTLSGGDSGGFSFNLDPKLAGSDTESFPPLQDFEGEASIPFRGSYIDAFPALRSPATPSTGFIAPPGLPYPHSNRSVYDPLASRSSSAAGHDNQPSGSGYMGSFNPFSDASEELPGTSASPLRRPQYTPLDDDSNRMVSRFGFARGRQGSASTSSPLHVTSPLSNGIGDNQPFYAPADGLTQALGRGQWTSNGRDYGLMQSTSNANSPLIPHDLDPTHPHPGRSHPQLFESGVSEAQLRDFIQSSRDRAQSALGKASSDDLISSCTHLEPIVDSHPPGLKFNPQFQDPAIMSARFASNTQDSGFNQMSYGPPPGLSFHQSGTNIGLGVMTNGMDGNGSAHVSTTASPSLSLALSSTDFPALTASPVEPSPHEESATTEDAAPVQLDAKAREKAERKAAKKAAAAEKAAERQRVAQEKAAVRTAERAKLALEKQAEKEKALVEKEKALAIQVQERAAKEQADKEKAARAKAETERLVKERAAQTEKERQKEKEKEEQIKKKQIENKRPEQPSKLSRQSTAPKPVTTSAPLEAQVPLLSKKPKKNKPATAKPIRVSKEEGQAADDPTTIPSITGSDAHLVPTDSSANNSRSHSLDRNSRATIEDLLEDIDILNPAMDLPNHPFFDTHKLSPAATVPLEYGPLVHALSALSVGGGSFANNMPSGSIDNAVSSFQQLLETLTQTISDLLRLLPRTTWDDSSSFDGVLRDMLKGDDFLDDGGDDGHGKEDEVATLTLALERRARWMEVQLSKLEELHRDINTAAVRAVLSFNDNGWDRRAFLPRIGNTLRRFDNIGFTEALDGTIRSMTADELEKKLAVAKEAAVFAETEVREVMERIQAIRPVNEM